MKKLAYGIGGLVVLLVAAALIVPSFIDWNAYKPEIAAQVKKATGRTLDLRGNIELAVLPAPHLILADAHLSNLPGAAATDMVALRQLRVSVKFAPLLQGKVQVASVELIDPVIELEKLADGTGNWTLKPQVAAGGAPAPSAPPGAVPSAPAPQPAGSPAGATADAGAFQLDSLKIVNGTVIYRDRAAGTVERIEKIGIELSAGSLAGPFALKGGLVARGLPLTVVATTGRFAEKGTVPVSARIGIAADAATVSLKGTVTDIETKPTAELRVESEGRNFGALIAGLSGGPAPTPAQPFSLTASVVGSESEISVGDLALKLGASSATGQAKVVLGDIVRANLALSSELVDLDAILAPASAPGGTRATAPAPNGTAGSPSAAAPAKSVPPAAAAAPAPILPTGIEANIDVSIVEAKYRDGRIRDVRLSASLKDGRLALNTMSLHFPGGAQFDASGTAESPTGGALTYAAKVAVRASSLRTTLEWLQIDVSSVAADRLRRMTLSADVSGNLQQVQFANIQMQLDASRMSGGVTLALRDRPAFGASFSIDQFNADAYVPPRGTASAPAVAGHDGADSPAAAASAAAAGGSPASPASPAKGPLAALDGFDANLALRIGSLNYQKTVIQGMQFDGTLVGGTLTIRDASVRNLAGTSAQIQGTVSGFSGIPSFKGTVGAASNDLTGLFQVAGIQSPVPPKRLGAMRLSSRTDVTQDRLDLKATLQIAEIRATLSGSATGLPAAPKFDLLLDAQHPELARLVSLFGDGKPGPAVGRAALKLSAKGGLDTVALDADTLLAGGAFRLSGKIDSPADKPKFDLTLALSHPDLVAFVRAFDPGFDPANPRLGSLKLDAALKGDETNLAIQGLKGNVGPTTLSGSGSYRDATPRPVLDLALVSGTIPISDFLGRKKPAAASPGGTAVPAGLPASGTAETGGGKAASGERWSREPIDVAALGLVDANVDLGAEALLYENIRVDRPKIVAVLKDKVLTVQKVSGKMFDGGFEAKGQIDGRGVPAATASVTIDKANVGKALFQAAAFDIANGTLTYGMDLTATGKSQYDMVKSLDGAGKINVADGVVKGFDLRAVSDSLKNKKDVAGMLGLFSSAMGGGSTKFTSLGGTFSVKKGIVRTSDLKLVADAGAGSASGFVDLPAWNMDMQSEFKLTEHPRAPAFRVRAVGPPDDPRRLFDFKELQAWILQEGVGGLLKDLIPGAKKGGTQNDQQQPQDKKQVNPADVLKGLLKGLGR